MRRIGWTCRACDRGEHGKCEWETNGVFCVCPCDTESVTPTDDNEPTTAQYVTAMTIGGMAAYTAILLVRLLT